MHKVRTERLPEGSSSFCSTDRERTAARLVAYLAASCLSCLSFAAEACLLRRGGTPGAGEGLLGACRARRECFSAGRQRSSTDRVGLLEAEKLG